MQRTAQTSTVLFGLGEQSAHTTSRWRERLSRPRDFDALGATFLKRAHWPCTASGHVGPAGSSVFQCTTHGNACNRIRRLRGRALRCFFLPRIAGPQVKAICCTGSGRYGGRSAQECARRDWDFCVLGWAKWCGEPRRRFKTWNVNCVPGPLVRRAKLLFNCEYSRLDGAPALWWRWTRKGWKSGWQRGHLGGTGWLEVPFQSRILSGQPWRVEGRVLRCDGADSSGWAWRGRLILASMRVLGPVTQRDQRKWTLRSNSEGAFSNPTRSDWIKLAWPPVRAVCAALAWAWPSGSQRRQVRRMPRARLRRWLPVYRESLAPCQWRRHLPRRRFAVGISEFSIHRRIRDLPTPTNWPKDLHWRGNMGTRQAAQTTDFVGAFDSWSWRICFKCRSASGPRLDRDCAPRRKPTAQRRGCPVRCLRAYARWELVALGDSHGQGGHDRPPSTGWPSHGHECGGGPTRVGGAGGGDLGIALARDGRETPGIRARRSQIAVGFP